MVRGFRDEVGRELQRQVFLTEGMQHAERKDIIRQCCNYYQVSAKALSADCFHISSIYSLTSCIGN